MELQQSAILPNIFYLKAEKFILTFFWKNKYIDQKATKFEENKT